MSQAENTLDRVFRAESRAVLATLIRILGDFDLAEDALQDAFTAALETWSKNGVPASPGAWLTTTARRKAIDRLRHLKIVEAKRSELALSLRLNQEVHGAQDEFEVSPIPDDQLRLIFTCCHPALAREAQVALTLHTLGGLSIAEIARAFLVSEATIAQRLARAKQKIVRARIPYEIPDRATLAPRLNAVLSVLYLMFNEGYLATSHGHLIRGDLVADALWLARGLSALLPDEPEPMGLLALMLLHDSRREARVSDAGDLVLLEDQDRTKWKHPQIEEGIRLIEQALRMLRPGPYQIQGAIAAVHAEAATAEDTDWRQIAILYEQLLHYERSPVIELNRAVAVSFAASPIEGLSLLEEMERTGALDQYAPFHLARADMFRRLDRTERAWDCYRRALPVAQNELVRHFIEQRMQQTSTIAHPSRLR
ncbi:MAG: RNA polymerase sigma factor [Acidobacteriia bacterium]|nr:RNA polymerase sigma factor [Terriglobia bacterium]